MSTLPARPAPQRVAVLGFSDFERGALATYFRLVGAGAPRYEQVLMLTQADFLIADADHLPSVQLVGATERMADAVFIGRQAPDGAAVWLARPIDALQVTRALDAMAAARGLVLPAQPQSKPRAPSLVERAAATGMLPLPETTVLPDGLLHDDARATALALPQPQSPPVPRALVVDDSEIAQRFLQSRLQPWGLQVDRAATSGQAITLMQRHSYDLVFVDLELGPASELDGLALCQHIKRSASAVAAAVIIVSAHHSEMDRVRGALAGCDGYLAKPLDPADLQRLLQRQGLKAPAAESSPAV